MSIHKSLRVEDPDRLSLVTFVLLVIAVVLMFTSTAFFALMTLLTLT